METNKTLIVQLIHEDLRIHHLMINLDNLGVEVDDLYRPNLLAVIQSLFEIPKGKSPDLFGQLYGSFMNRSLEFDVSGSFDQYVCLAEACYEALLTVKKSHIDGTLLTPL